MRCAPAAHAALFLVLACQPVSADPVSITGGTVIFTDEPGDFRLTGPGFDLQGWWFPSTVRGTFWFDRCHPDLTGGGCAPGSRIDFGTTTYGIGFGDSTGIDQGSGTIGGVAYDQLFYRGQWTFHGPSVVAPTTFDESPLTRDGRFVFEGSLAAYATDSRTGLPLFSANLRGSGTARAYFGVETSLPGGPRLLVHDLDYFFDDTAPVPEPSTLLLAGTALGAAFARYRRRSR